MACDSLRNVEVVLSNGTVVEANAEENSDLFTALRGGGGNFGIVTRFDVETFETKPIWVWNKEYPESAGEQMIGALQRWTDGLESYPNSSALVFWSYRFGLKETRIICNLADVTGREMAPVFEELAYIPGNLTFSTAMANMSTVAINYMATGYR